MERYHCNDENFRIKIYQEFCNDDLIKILFSLEDVNYAYIGEILPFSSEAKQIVEINGVRQEFTMDKDKEIYNHCQNTICKKYQDKVLENGPFVGEDNLIIYLYEQCFNKFKQKQKDSIVVPEKKEKIIIDDYPYFRIKCIPAHNNLKEEICYKNLGYGFLIHFKIVDGELKFIREFSEKLADNGKYTRLDDYFNNCIIHNNCHFVISKDYIEYIYDFETSKTSNSFNRIITKSNLTEIEKYLKNSYDVNVIDYLSDYIKDKDIAIGIKTIKSDILNISNENEEINIWVELDNKGNIIGDIYYIVDGELKNVTTSNSTFENDLLKIKNILENHIVTEKIKQKKLDDKLKRILKR